MLFYVSLLLCFSASVSLRLPFPSLQLPSAYSGPSRARLPGRLPGALPAHRPLSRFPWLLQAVLSLLLSGQPTLSLKALPCSPNGHTAQGAPCYHVSPVPLITLAESGLGRGGEHGRSTL